MPASHRSCVSITNGQNVGDIPLMSKIHNFTIVMFLLNLESQLKSHMKRSALATSQQSACCAVILLPLYVIFLFFLSVVTSGC